MIGNEVTNHAELRSWVERNEISKVRELLQKGNFWHGSGRDDSDDGMTPVHYAAANNRGEILDLLLASLKPEVELLRAVLRAGNYMMTPLGLAVYQGHFNISVKLLNAAYESGLLEEVLLVQDKDGKKRIVDIPISKEIKELLNNYMNKYLSSTAASTTATNTDGAQVSVPPSVAQQVTRSSSSTVGNSRV